MRFGHTQTATL